MVKTIANPAGAYGLSPDFQDYISPAYTNNPLGTTRQVGDVVSMVAPPNNTTAYYNPAVDGTTTAADVNVIGVVSEDKRTGPDSGQVGGGVGQAGGAGPTARTYAAGAEMPVVTEGIARINVSANTVAAGAFLVTSTATGVAAASATPTLGTVIAVALDPSTNAVTVGGKTTIRAIIKKM
jgi:hypothetical protein